MEQITLGAPVLTDPGATVFRITHILFNWAESEIAISLREWTGTAFTGRQISAGYSGAVAASLMATLNTMNFSTVSLHRRIILRLQADGKLPSGTLSGAPD